MGDWAKKFLTYLDDRGIGNTVNINPVLLEYYGDPGDLESDQDFMTAATRIRSFLSALQNDGLITYTRGNFGSMAGGQRYSFDNTQITARITYKGTQSLIDNTPITQHNIHIGGNVTGSMVGSQQMEDVVFKPVIKAVREKKKVIKVNDGKRNILEIIAWIVGILVGLIALWEFLLKKL